MAKFARLDGTNTVIELFEHATATPDVSHVPAIAAQFNSCPDGVQLGWVKSKSGYAAPPVAPTVVVPPKVTPPQFKLLIMPELPAILEKAESDVTVRAFISVIDDPRLTEVDLSLQSTQLGLQYCFKAIGKSDADTATRIAAVLTGRWT